MVLSFQFLPALLRSNFSAPCQRCQHQPSSMLPLVSENQLLQASCKLPRDQQGTNGTYSSGSQPSKLLIMPTLRYGGSFLHSLSLGYLHSLFPSFQSINTFFILINAIYPVPHFKTNWYGFWSPKWTLSDTTKNDTVGSKGKKLSVFENNGIQWGKGFKF